MTTKSERFIAGLRSDITKKNYAKWLDNVLQPDPDTWLQAAKIDPSQAEEGLIDWIIKERGRIASMSVSSPLVAVKSFCDENKVELDWRRIRKKLPPMRKYSPDRAPSIEEIRALVSVGPPRLKLIVTLLLSLGGRIGAFYFAKSGGGFQYMKLKDVTFLDSGLARVTVYPGEAEAYTAFFSKEATDALKVYIEERKKIGERITGESPVLRDMWDYSGDATGRVKNDPKDAHPMTTTALSPYLWRYWGRTGLKKKAVDGGFKGAHGFRKYFLTNFPPCPVHGNLDAEVLAGHLKAYHRPTSEHLEQTYLKAQSVLTVSEAAEAKAALAISEKGHEAAWNAARVENIELKERLAKMEEYVAIQIEEDRRRKIAQGKGSKPD